MAAAVAAAAVLGVVASIALPVTIIGTVTVTVTEIVVTRSDMHRRVMSALIGISFFLGRPGSQRSAVIVGGIARGRQEGGIEADMAASTSGRPASGSYFLLLMLCS